MFESLTSDSPLPLTNTPMRIAARQMRWLRRAFIDHVRALERQFDCRFEVDTTKLGAAYGHWLRAVERERRSGPADRRQFMDFAASLMMQELVREAPLVCISAPARAKREEPIAFWPEGLAYTLFCLHVHAAVIREEYGEVPARDERLEQISFWWTYRENSLDDYRTVSGFFQLMLGYVPNWDAPNRYRALRRGNQAS